MARDHGITRVRIGFDIGQLVHEFVVLRRVIFDVVQKHEPGFNPADSGLTELLDSAIGVAVQSYVDAEVEAIAIAKKDKARTIPILGKLLKLDPAKADDAAALSQTYDFYVTTIFPSYPHPTVATFTATRDALVATNAKVKDLDVSKVIEDKYVADAEKRGVGK